MKKLIIIILIAILFSSCVTININYCKPQPQQIDTLNTSIESWY